ncbi:MAG TPA: DotU family type IV/VI secretion system protein [Campylobacterales bacterium]|nr:DotU family type IV/VI secretion system protein [Sulfurospirillum arcachonense]HIP51698.1 DotU family type IV/VI secretion system protein [Campylobacterales bacterium]
MENKTTIINSNSNVSIKRVKNKENTSDYKKHTPTSQREYVSISSELDSPLLFASKEIFKETYRLQNQESISDVKGTSQFMINELDIFSNIAMEQGVNADQILMSRYILCTFIDEMLSSASWATDNTWSGVSLLNYYYSEGYGGDKFFQLLVRFEEEPTTFIYVMELAYVCLSFGYGGKYKSKNGSIQDLGAVKENLYRQIKTTKPKKEKFYVNHPAAQRHHKLYSKLSRKIILAVALLLMLVIYAIFTYTIQNNETSLIHLLQDEHRKMKVTHVRSK